MGFVFLHVRSTVSAKQIQKLNLKRLMVCIFGALVRTEASQSPGPVWWGGVSPPVLEHREWDSA